MLTAAFPFLHPRRLESELPARLRNLAGDIERVRSGAAPSRSELAEAPLIDDWRAVLTPLGLRLSGMVIGHPSLGDRPAIISQLWAADHNGWWVRTLSRFYQLGRAAGADKLGDLHDV